MATKLKFPQGSSQSFLLSFVRDNGDVESLDGATLAGYLKRSVFDADADALVDLADRLSIYDAQAGLAILALEPEDTADLDPFLSLEWQVRATLSDGRVFAHPYHQGPVAFAPMSGESAFAEPPNDYVELVTDMSTTPSALASITGLTGGTSADLDGLTAARLVGFPHGTQIDLFFSGSIAVRYRIRDRSPALEAEVGPSAGGFKILCDHDADRLWELVRVTREGVPCVWNPDTTKWHQVLAQGTGTGVAPALAQEAEAFSLPA